MVQLDIELLLHQVNCLAPCHTALNAEVLVQQGSVQSFHKAFALKTAHLGGAMFNPDELHGQLVGMLVGAPAKLTAIA